MRKLNHHKDKRVNSDVDYMLIFDNSDNKKPQSFLDRIKKFAETKYSTSEIHIDVYVLIY